MYSLLNISEKKNTINHVFHYFLDLPSFLNISHAKLLYISSGFLGDKVFPMNYERKKKLSKNKATEQQSRQCLAVL